MAAPSMHDFQYMDSPSSMSIPMMLKPYPSIHLEIRLFYIRFFAPCAALDAFPRHLMIRHLHRNLGLSLEINGTRIPDLNPATLALKRDRVDKDAYEATYLSTDSVRISGSIEFEVLDDEDVVLCGSVERMDDNWIKEGLGFEKNSRTGWSMDCYAANPISSGRSSRVSAPLIEFYIAGCCSGSPVILTKTIEVSPRRKNSRQGMLDSIPEDEEVGKEERESNGFLSHTSSLIPGLEEDEYESGMKFGHSFYSQDMYTSEDGEISWFNAGVRVGVGISLGVCVGVGLSVGLLMRSYQATTRNFRRRFF